MMDKNWPRWIFASMTEYFSDAINIPVFIEGMDRETKDLKDFAEIRVDGPWMNELSVDVWKFRIEINILIQSVMGDKNLHRFYDDIGDVNFAFTNCISVYKHPDINGQNGDGSFLGCFKLAIDRYDRENIKTSNYGQIDKNVKLQQATIEAHYEMFLNI